MSTGRLRPTRRTTTHVEPLHDELCVYEWTTNTVHALNPAAARIWEMCDGNTTVDEMTVRVQHDLNEAGADLVVRHALAQFARAGLLEPATLTDAPPTLSRRALLRRLGAAAAIPVVTSIVAPTPLAAQSGGTATFTFTGGPQSFVVPPGVTALRVDARGARGTNIPIKFNLPGQGGRVQATLPVAPGETLTVMVGSQGDFYAGTPGFNGGGAGAYGGGGATDLRRGSARILVAGAGGGGGFNDGRGGNGGGLVAISGTGTCGAGGAGGTQVAGGAGGAGGPGAASGSQGMAFTGGNGAAGWGGGGGGGFFGGGGGGACANLAGGSGGGGGGGSSYTDPSATDVVHTQGGTAGDGSITLNW